MKARLLPTLALLAFLPLAACEEGPVDPFDGNAGIVSLPVFTFDVSSADLNDTVLSEQYEVPAITPDVVDFGAVLVYFREQGTWTAMPYTYGVESAEVPAVDYTVSLGYAYDDRLLELFYEVSSPEAVDPLDLPDREIKVVILESLPVGKNAVDLRDYEAVRRYYNLPD